MLKLSFRFPAFLTLALFGLSALRSVSAGEPPAGMLICVNANPVAPYVAIEVQAGVKAEWPTLSIAPFRTGSETFEELQDVTVTYPPAKTDLESDESEAVVKAGGNTLTVDFEKGRKGTVQSKLIAMLDQQVPVGKVVYPAILELDEASIRVGEIEMSCVALEM